MFFKVANQDFTIGLSFFKLTQAVQFKAYRRNTEFFPKSVQHQKLFCVCIRTLKAHRFHTELVELAIAASLRSFVTEHRSHVPKTARCIVKQVVFDTGAHDGCGVLRTKRKVISVQRVHKGIHFFFYDIGHFADTAFKQASLFNNRSADLLITVEFSQSDRFFFKEVPKRRVRREHIAHTADRLNFLLCHFYSFP